MLISSERLLAGEHKDNSRTTRGEGGRGKESAGTIVRVGGRRQQWHQTVWETVWQMPVLAKRLPTPYPLPPASKKRAQARSILNR